MSEFVTVAKAADLPVGATLAVEVQGKQLGLFNCDGHIYAIDNVCTHAYAELHEGELDDDDCSIECPLHGARFDLATGRALSLPATTAVEVYPVRVENDSIQVELP